MGITQSMSRAGTPYDNAPMERYYNTLKAELINQYHFRTDRELNDAISQFAYEWYNKIRPHSYNGYLTPHEKRARINWAQVLQKCLTTTFIDILSFLCVCRFIIATFYPSNINFLLFIVTDNRI